MSLHHCNRTDLSKLLVRFAHVVDVDGRILDKSDLRAARVTMGCDRLSSIPRKFNAVFGRQICKIGIRVEARITAPMDPEIRVETSAKEGHGEDAPLTSQTASVGCLDIRIEQVGHPME